MPVDSYVLATDDAPTIAVVVTEAAAEVLHGLCSRLRVVSSPAELSVLPQRCVVVAAHPRDVLHDAWRGAPNIAWVAVVDGASSPEDAADVEEFVFVPASANEVAFRAQRASARRWPVQPVLADGVLRLGEGAVAVSASEQRLLARLIEAHGTAVSPPALVAALGDHPALGRALDAHIYRLRGKLRALPSLQIETVRQRGFRLRNEG